jgi:hypothetical protein
MTKEYDNNNKGSLWLSDKETIKGDKYYNGDINIEGKVYKITMFKNVNIKSEQKGQAVSPKEEVKEEDPYETFGNTIELSDDDIAF